MKKIINQPEHYTDDMLRGIYAAYPDQVKYVDDNLRCYCTAKKVPGKVSIVTGGGTGHLPLFLGFVGENLLDGCAVGSVFQSPSAEWIYNVSKEVDNGAGVLYLYGNYSGDIMNFEMATLDEVLATTQKVKERVRTVGFAMSPCTIPEVGHPNFTLEEGEMSMGMGIHGEPGIWNAPIKTSKELAKYTVETILADMPMDTGEKVAILLNGLGATSIEELYILNADIHQELKDRGITVVKTYVGEYATSMEMTGASVSICLLDDELKGLLELPASTPFFHQF